MTNYEKHLEKVWRDGMVVGAIYNFIGKGTGGTDRNHIIADDAVAAGNIRECCTAGVESCRCGAVVCLVAGRDAAADNQRLGIYCQCVGC